MKKRDISNDNEIKMYLHCVLCLKELEKGDVESSPSFYQEIEVGWTRWGIQIWCKRHNVNIIHIDFEEKKHPANVTRKAFQKKGKLTN